MPEEEETTERLRGVQRLWAVDIEELVDGAVSVDLAKHLQQPLSVLPNRVVVSVDAGAQDRVAGRQHFSELVELIEPVETLGDEGLEVLIDHPCPPDILEADLVGAATLGREGVDRVRAEERLTLRVDERPSTNHARYSCPPHLACKTSDRPLSPSTRRRS